MSHRFTRHAALLHRLTQRMYRLVLDRVRPAWGSHRRLLHDNPSYATAFATGAAAIFTQDTFVDLAAALAAAFIGVYAATRRSIIRW